MENVILRKKDLFPKNVSDKCCPKVSDVIRKILRKSSIRKR